MAKRNEYPENKGIRARMEAILLGFSHCHSVLDNIKWVLESEQPISGSLRETLKKQVEGALVAAKTGLDAIAGDQD